MNEKVPGKGLAIASLILGIVSLICCCFGSGAIIAVILGIIGLVVAGKAKREGYIGGMRTAGFVCSLIGLCVGGVVFVVALMALGSLASLAMAFA